MTHLKNGKWVLCPVRGNKTRIKARPDTVLENFPLFCPKCRQETVIMQKTLSCNKKCHCVTAFGALSFGGRDIVFVAVHIFVCGPHDFSIVGKLLQPVRAPS